MQKNIKLSITIATYNRPQAVIRAIESCFSCKDIPYEIIIWDNHSDPENMRIVSDYCAKSECVLRYYYSDYNKGPGGGKNEAWKKSRGEYVFFMDDDAVIVSDNYFSRLIDYMEMHPHVGIAYTTIYEPETGKYYDCEYTYVNAQKETEKIAFLGGAHIIRRSAVYCENLYPRKTTFGSEESYASLHIWDNNFQVHKIEDLIVHHLPEQYNRYLGKERDRAFILSAYAMKKLTYPKLLQPLAYIFFLLHLRKNNLKYDAFCKEWVASNFCVEDIQRISYSCLFNLAKKFGLLPLI